MWGKLEISFWMALFLYCNDNNDNTGTCLKLIKSSIFGHAGRQGGISFAGITGFFTL